MKMFFAAALIFVSVNVFAQPNCSKAAAKLASDEYANDNFGDHASTSVHAIIAKDGSTYYRVIARGNSGAKVYTVIFDDPTSCDTQTARVYERKK